MSENEKLSPENENAISILLKSDIDLVNYFDEKSEDEGRNKINEKTMTSEGNTSNSDDYSEKRKTLRQKLFSKIEPGSIRGSIFALTSVVLGPGSFSLPHALNKMSLFLGVLSIIIAAILMHWSYSMVLYSSEKYKTFDYSDLVKKCFGKKFGKLFNSVIMILLFGVLTMYQVISIIKLN